MTHLIPETEEVIHFHWIPDDEAEKGAEAGDVILHNANPTMVTWHESDPSKNGIYFRVNVSVERIERMYAEIQNIKQQTAMLKFDGHLPF